MTAAAAAPAAANAQPSTPEQDAARKAAADEIRKWRLAAPMDKAQALRKKFEDAGILVEIVKVDNILSMADEVIDYEFRLAKTLGARAISTEITHIDPKRRRRLRSRKAPRRICRQAQPDGRVSRPRGDQPEGMEGSVQLRAAQRRQPRHRPLHRRQQDLTGAVPEGAARSHHARPREGRKSIDGANVPFGTGDTPIKEVLQLIRDNKWPIQATIEFEYPVPAGSDRMTELKKCVDYCRAALA